MTKSSSPKPTNVVLQLKSVTKTYHLGDETIDALNHVNVQIKRGELISIIGPSGSGKSTLLQIAGLLDKPTSGSVYLNGQLVSSMDEKQLAKVRNKQVGFIFQQFNLLKKTSALDNVALPLIYAGIAKKTRDQKARQMLGKVGLSDRLKNTPAQLSGGQQQRVAIARGLAMNPSILLADEPTGNIASSQAKEIMTIFKKIKKNGHTIVMITHEPDIAKYAKRIIYIKDGRIFLYGHS